MCVRMCTVCVCVCVCVCKRERAHWTVITLLLNANLLSQRQAEKLFANHALDLYCLPVQLFHNSAANFRVHASVNFLVYGDQRPLLKPCFLKCLETSPFCWWWFCRCMINRLSHALQSTRNILTNGALITKIYLASRANLNISAFVHVQRVQKWLCVSSGTKSLVALGKIAKMSLLLFLWMTKSATLRRLSVFQECPIDFYDFQEQIW